MQRAAPADVAVCAQRAQDVPGGGRAIALQRPLGSRDHTGGGNVSGPRPGWTVHSCASRPIVCWEPSTVCRPWLRTPVAEVYGQPPACRGRGHAFGLDETSELTSDGDKRSRGILTNHLGLASLSMHSLHRVYEVLGALVRPWRPIKCSREPVTAVLRDYAYHLRQRGATRDRELQEARACWRQDGRGTNEECKAPRCTARPYFKS